MKKIILFLSFCTILLSCKKTDEVNPDLTTNFIGSFSQTINTYDANYGASSTVYDLSFAKKDNSTLSLNYVATSTYTQNNQKRR
jgi:hypothetical protein